VSSEDLLMQKIADINQDPTHGIKVPGMANVLIKTA
jgi:hypothetical protein